MDRVRSSIRGSNKLEVERTFCHCRSKFLSEYTATFINRYSYGQARCFANGKSTTKWKHRHGLDTFGRNRSSGKLIVAKFGEAMDHMNPRVMLRGSVDQLILPMSKAPHHTPCMIRMLVRSGKMECSVRKQRHVCSLNWGISLATATNLRIHYAAC